jgi:hypothetical protein
MKLYTEEQVRQMLFDLGDVLFNNNQNGIEEGEPAKHFDEILNGNTPIELPSDEELWLMSEQHAAFCELQNFFDEDEIIIIRHHWIKGYEKAIKDFLNSEYK